MNNSYLYVKVIVIVMRGTTKAISILLILSMLISCVACSSRHTEATTFTLSNPDSKTFTENIVRESIVNENAINEFITEETYLNEIVVAEETITELLIDEEQINEVLICKVIYVSESNIEEFAEHSQTSSLFGEDINWSAFLKKIAVGTGVIVTLVVLKTAKFPEPICSVVAEAADKSLEFAESGAVVGSIYGGLTGAADEIDKSGRTSAVLGLATTTVGLILAILGLVSTAHSAGTSNFATVKGVQLVLAGISVVASSIATVSAGVNCIRTFRETDVVEIDWENVDWEAVGYSAAEKAIENGADGYVCGAIVGAVYGGIEGYEKFHKTHAPYSTYKQRVDRTPINSERGKWTGERGESTYELSEPITRADGKVIDKASYTNGVVDLSHYSEAEVKITNMNDNRNQNFKKADEVLAKLWDSMRYKNRRWTAKDIEKYRKNFKLSWHEMNNMSSMQLVPEEANSSFGHLGGVAEYKCSIGQAI